MTTDYTTILAGCDSLSGEHMVPFRTFILLFALLCVACEARAGQVWDFDDATIRESTAVYERPAISTAGRPNPNNMNLNVPGQPGFQLSTAGNSLVFMVSNVIPQFAIALKPSAAKQLHLYAAAFYFQGFLWWDTAPFIDGHLPRVNQSAPNFNRWAGDGWSLNSFGTNEMLTEVSDAYVDLRKDLGPLDVGLRLGKERFENGNEFGPAVQGGKRNRLNRFST